MAHKNLSNLTSLLRRSRLFSITHIAPIKHQECSWSRARSLHASSRVAAAPTSSATGSSETNIKEAIIPDRLIWKLEVHCQGHDKAVMESYRKFLQMTCQHLGLNAEAAVHGTASHERITLLKSVHIHGKHRVQYEMQTYPLDLVLYQLTGSTADTFLEYIQRMCPEGVIMKVTEHTLSKFPASIMQVISDARDKNGGVAEEAGGAAEEAKGAAEEAKGAAEEAKGAARGAGGKETSEQAL